MVGLSGAIVTTIYVGVFRPDIESFMLFLAVFIGVVTVRHFTAWSFFSM